MADGRRMFFALWPDERVRERLAALSKPWRPVMRCRWTAPEKLHLTLAFLGQVPEQRLPALEAIGDAVASKPFTFRLDRLELWQRAQVLCLTVGAPPAELQGLAAALASALAAAGFPTEKRPFRGHVTLARRAKRLPAEAESIPETFWHATELALVESNPDLDGGPYRCRKTWRLSGNRQS